MKQFWPDPISDEYWAPRRCLREPIPEIFEAACLLDEAANAHLKRDAVTAERLILSADIPSIRDWIESLWGSKERYPEKEHCLRIRQVQNLPPLVPHENRIKSRRADKATEQAVLLRFGWNCAYCGIPLISRDARDVLRRSYPNAMRWGTNNDAKHVAFMCMDNEFDHLVPHSRGGTNAVENLVTACAPCNCGKENWTLDQLGLLDPRGVAPKASAWDGLERLKGHG